MHLSNLKSLVSLPAVCIDGILVIENLWYRYLAVCVDSSLCILVFLNLWYHCLAVSVDGILVIKNLYYHYLAVCIDGRSLYHYLAVCDCA